ADMPAKVIEYGLKLAKRSLETYCAEEAVRAARLVLDFLEYHEEPSRLIEGEARLLLGAAYRMKGSIDAAIQEMEESIKNFESEFDPIITVNAIVLIAETAWEGRKFEKAKAWVEQGVALARTAGEVESLVTLLSLGAAVANLRGEYEKAKQFLAE